MTPVELTVIPQFGAFEPDIVVMPTPADDEIEILPDGHLTPIQPRDSRKALLVSDIKHAGEANSSYSSEVVLYAVLLADWLWLNDLKNSFFVADRLELWIRAKESSALSQLIAVQPGATPSDSQSFLCDLEHVDSQIFFQTVSHFIRAVKGIEPGRIQKYSTLSGRRYPIRQVLVSVTKLPAIAITSRDAHRVLEKFGFTVDVE